LIEEAERLGLGAIALCDHNSVAGLPEFTEAAKGKDVEAIPGIEITTEYRETELHILGLQIAPSHYDRITAMMEDLLIRKERSEQALIQALNREGMDLSYEQIKAKTKGGYVNRAHIAVALVEKGFAPDFRSAFRLYLRPEKGYYVPPKRLDVFETIAMLKSMGAAVVLAHPFLDLDEVGLREFLPKAKECGLDGMETLYPKYSPETTVTAFRVAEDFGLKQSGGSDFHGENKPDIALGTGRGDLHIPSNWLNKLRNAKN
jgi:predicted metal-dependent phosphoesterase TrpH